MFLRSGGGGMRSGGLGTSIVSPFGRANTGSGGVNPVGLARGEKYMASLVQEDLLCDGREPVEV